MTERIKRNISNNYLYMLLKIDYTQGFWMIYLASKGLSLIELGLLETIFHITSFTMEIPTGMIADVYGRKSSRIIGRIFFVLAMVLLLNGDQFWIFAGGFVLSAISYNLESGAGEAFVYDSLKALGEEARYLKVTGRLEGIYQLTGLIAFLVGGVVAGIDYRWLFYLSLGFAFLTLLPALRWSEPPFRKKESESLSVVEAFIQLIKESFRLVRTNRKISFFIFSMEFLLSVATVLFFYLQNFWKNGGFSEIWIGVFFALSAVMGILGGLSAEKIESVLGQKRFLILFPLLTTIGVWIIALTPWHVATFIAITFIDSLIYVGMNEYINREIESHIRATVISFASMAFSFYMIILFPAFGWVAESFGFQAAFMFLASISSIVWIFNVYFLNRNLE